MIFDTAAGELSPKDFQQQIEPLLVKLAKIYPGKLGYYSKGTQPAHLSQNLLAAPWAGIGVDHRWDLPKFLTSTNKGFVQGNFDQTLLHLPTSEFEVRFREYLKPSPDRSTA